MNHTLHNVLSAALAAVLAAFCLSTTVVPALAGDEGEPPGLDEVLADFAEAWKDADAEAANAFLLDKGAEVSLAPRKLAAQPVTPARGRYLFEDLFRDVKRSRVVIDRVTEPGEDGLAHAVFVWTYRRGGRDREERVFSSWTLWQGRWRMSELRLGR